MDSKILLYLIVATPLFLLVIFILFLVIKKPQIVSQAAKEASRDRPRSKAENQALLAMYYVLDEIRTQEGFKWIYYIGIIGVIGTTILIFALIFIYLPTILKI